MTEIKRTFGTDERGRHFCELTADLPENHPKFSKVIGVRVYASEGKTEPSADALINAEGMILSTLYAGGAGGPNGSF